jgi:mRNA interferase MazF
LVAGTPARGDVFLVSLDPTVGGEPRKARPCVILSPDELSSRLGTYIVAPMTTGGHAYPFRLACRFAGKDGFVVLDQLRTVDRRRLVKRMGRIAPARLTKALAGLREMFAE